MSRDTQLPKILARQPRLNLKINAECGIQRADLEGMIVEAAKAYKTVWNTIGPEIAAKRASSFFTLYCSMSDWDRGAYDDELDGDDDDTPNSYELSATLQYVEKAASIIARITKISVDNFSYGNSRGVVFKETIAVKSGKV
jgi:hypothetical protein